MCLLCHLSCVTLDDVLTLFELPFFSPVSWESTTCFTGLWDKRMRGPCTVITKARAKGRSDTPLTTATKTVKLPMMVVKMSLVFFELQKDILFFLYDFNVIKTSITLVYFA